MTCVIFDGEGEARKREERLRQQIIWEKRVNLRLVTIVFAEDQAGQIYARLKGEAAIRVGIAFERVDHSIKDDHRKLVQEIMKICLRPEVTGVMIQKPSKKILEGKEGWWHGLTQAIDPKKDVDCLTQENLKKVEAGTGKLLPATVRGIMTIIESTEVRGKAVVVGRSEIVGKPLAAVLLKKGLEVDLLGSKTADLRKFVQEADLVVSATGIKHLIKGEWIKPGAVVIDVGSPDPEIEFESAKTRASLITPVPYGVGPMTVVSLLENLVQYAG